MTFANQKRRAFSLIELVIVVVIIAIIAAIAVPKMSRGAAGASDAALMQNLAQMRSAIDLFVAEHGGVYPSTTAVTFAQQLTQYSDVNGSPSATKIGAYIYGPYLKAIPPLPVGTNKGQSTVQTSGTLGAAGAGWFYDGTNLTANLASSEVDAQNKAYNIY